MAEEVGQDLLARIVYLSAYCCVAFPTVPAYAPTEPAPAVLAYATQPDEPQVIVADAQVDPETWGRLPRNRLP